MVRTWAVAVLIGGLLLGGSLRSQPKAETPGADRLTAFAQHQAMVQSSPYRNAAWQYLGPTNIGGRVNDVAVADRDGHRRIYLGFSGSGLWASDDDAASWQPIFTDAPTPAILSVAVAPSNPSIVWILTGTNRSHIPLASAGVFRSTDAGRSWEYMGLPDIGQGSWGQIVVHPTRPDTVYVGVTGGPNPRDTRGLFKTVNGGKTWDRVFAQGANVGPWQVVMDPTSPETLYVATRARARGNEVALLLDEQERPSIFKTSDGGKTWKGAANGLPPAALILPGGGNAMTLDISGSNPHVLYAALNHLVQPVRSDGPPTAQTYSVYRSDDGARTWQETSEGQFLPADSPSGEFLRGLRVDPHDDRTGDITECCGSAE